MALWFPVIMENSVACKPFMSEGLNFEQKSFPDRRPCVAGSKFIIYNE